MQPTHLLNVFIHVGCGIAAMAVGFIILAGAKGTMRHRQLGRRFAWLTLGLCGSAVAGNLLFRFIPVFAILTVLVLYQFVGGWRAVHTKERGPALVDAAMTACAATLAFALAPIVIVAARADGSSAVVYSSLGALAMVIAYDTCRWWFPAHWHATLWRYEHVYKTVASLFGMLSAASGNLIRFGQPWSQLLPSAFGIATIGWMLWRLWRGQRRSYRAMR
ncbi:hypothetical protein [Massilia sp. TWR1-2-2]|uniref:hypothetical protein n=1 Tax=Massilia sp. TWR1-2-2 TaxID=2804584 RepID=UPI003CE8FC90